MTFLEYLQLQPVESDDPDSPLNQYAKDETISLDEGLENEVELEEFWRRVCEEEELDSGSDLGC